MPLKRVALGLADEASSRATTVGAANTLLPLPGSRWRADNTDVAGIVAALAEAQVHPASVSLLGAGGTAQAAVVALAEIGIGRLAVLVRNANRVDELRATAARAGVTVDVGALHDDAALAADLLISTLPPGAADALAERGWRAGQAVLDVVYSPWPTPLAAAVAAGGGTVVSGALMLLHQAAAQVELMTSQAAPVDAMRDALRAAAPGCGL